MSNQLIPIVNQEDEIIWHKARSEITKDDIYRVSALWIENSQWEVLLAQRGFMKKNNPGKWWPAVAWTIDIWETYEENIYKEAFEELWIQDKKFVFSQKLFNNGPKFFYFCSWYFLILDADISEFILEYPHVESVRWFSKEEIRNMLQNSPESLSAVEYMKWKFQ
jgi:isopentenyldiphosphate isomerase